jgi:pterin-4a-carbinolamine dehydratase
MTFGTLPVQAKEAEAPVIAVERWHDVDGTLMKTYHFRRDGDRDLFVNGLFEHENEVKHNALIIIQGDKVALRLKTHNIDRVTELDREYARFADSLFKDVVYSPSYGAESE